MKFLPKSKLFCPKNYWEQFFSGKNIENFFSKKNSNLFPNIETFFLEKSLETFFSLKSKLFSVEKDHELFF
jgi:hypothetical protein